MEELRYGRPPPERESNDGESVTDYLLDRFLLLLLPAMYIAYSVEYTDIQDPVLGSFSFSS